MLDRRTPEQILDLTTESADDLLAQLEALVPVRPGLVELPGAPFHEAIVFGDTHGDWRTTEAVVGRFLSSVEPRVLLGLGDYVDRAPVDCREGSVANSLYLLQLAAEFPDRVLLLQGNHETDRKIPVVPHDLPEEIDALWGPEIERYSRLEGLLERGPLAAASSNGGYFAHAGFLRRDLGPDWRKAFAHLSDQDLAELVWTDCAASPAHRGVTEPFSERELEQFLGRTGLSVFLRGHDPHLLGRSVYHDRCLTLHTSRIYESYGGVICARVPLDRPIRTTRDIRVEHLETEGKEFA